MRSILRFIGILCCGAILAFSCIRFYSERLPPSFPPFDQAYHFLHGNSPHPSEDRPFPQGQFVYNSSYKLDTGYFGPSIYGTLTTILITEDSTEVVIVFYAIDRNSLPPISTLAPQPAIHVGQSVFPARVIRTTYRPGRERQYTFVFAPIGDIEGDSVHVYLDNRSDKQRYQLRNPAAEGFFFERTGTNAWGVLVIVSLFFIGALWAQKDDGLKALVDTLLGQWRVMDSARQAAAESLSDEDWPVAQIERHRSAQRSLDRAERIIMDLYEDSFKSRLWATWAGVLLLALCLLLVAFFILMPKGIGLGGGDPGGLEQRSFLAERLELLEQGRNSTTGYLVLGMLIGFSALAANLVLSIGHTRAVVRKRIRHSISELDTAFQEQLVRKVDDAERVLQKMKIQASSMNEELEGAYSYLQEQRELSGTP